MDVNESKPTQGSANMETNSQRTRDSRQQIIALIANKLKQLKPPYCQNEAQIMDIAARVEQKVFKSATSEVDYKQKIIRELSSVKLLVPPCAAENPGNQVGVQQANGAGPAAVTSAELTNPGLSASPLLESSSNLGNNPGNPSERTLHESSVVENPLQHLLRVVKSLSPTTLRESYEDLESVSRIADRIPVSVPEVARTEYHLQEKTFSPEPLLIEGGTSVAKISEMESRNINEVKSSLMEEIGMINKRLINTVVEIENNNSATAAPSSEDSQAKIVKCSFIAEYFSANFPPIQPLKLLIPGKYPTHPASVLEKSSAPAREGDASSNLKNESMSEKAMSKLERELQTLEQPLTIEIIAKAWDVCTHSVVCEYAEQCGGGSFSSRYGVWEKCANNS